MLTRLKNRIQSRTIQKEGGQQTSAKAREIAKNNNVLIDLYTYGSCFSLGFNNGGKEVIIGRYCSFGPNVRFFGANHPIHYASMSPYFYRKEWGFKVDDVPRSTLVVGHDVWLGCDTIITSSCTKIGNGAVIAAGAVVTKDVPPYSIVMGVPAKVKSYRFDEETILAIEKSKWWECTPEELMQFYNLIKSPKEWAEAITDMKRNRFNEQK